MQMSNDAVKLFALLFALSCKFSDEEKGYRGVRRRIKALHRQLHLILSNENVGYTGFIACVYIYDTPRSTVYHTCLRCSAFLNVPLQAGGYFYR